MNYYMRHIGDYYKKAGRLSILQHGAYTLLQDACYDRERFPASVDEAIEWCWASSTEEREAVEFVLSKFFTEIDGYLVQKRVLEEVERYRVTSVVNRLVAVSREAKKARNDDLAKSCDALRDKIKSEIKNGALTENHEALTHRVESLIKSNAAPPNQEPLTINQEPLTISNNNTLVDSEQPTDVDDDFRLEQEIDGKVKKPKVPPCPHQEIIALYHEILPECDSVLVERWPNSQRATDLKNRWRESRLHQDLEFWGWFFTGIKTIRQGFYVSDQGGPWKANLGWLIKKTKFIELCEQIVNEESRR